MATINASTKHTISGPAKTANAKSSASNNAKKPSGAPAASKKGPAANNAAGRRGSVAPVLKPGRTAAELEAIIGRDDSGGSRKESVREIFHQCLGEHVKPHYQTPHASSTTRDRSHAAADLAFLAKRCGVPYIMIECDILSSLQRMLFPFGIQNASLFTAAANEATNGNIITSSANEEDATTMNDNPAGDDNTNTATGNENNTNVAVVLKPSASAVSLSSMVDQWTMDSGNDDGTAVIDDKSRATNDSMTRGTKITPPNAREGCYLLIRSLIETLGSVMEPYVVGAFLSSAIEECASSSSHVREAAEDASNAIVAIASPYIFRPILVPLLLHYIQYSTEWRIKSCALERLHQCATLFPEQVNRAIPALLPVITSQVWDTKIQVSKAAQKTLSAICYTNTNSDIKPTIPSLINAMCKPSDTNKAISDLMGTTFVVPIDASVLAMLCPLLSRGLKEKMAIHKRSACLVVHNMSKLVETPAAIAPFKSLLIPELQRVIQNVQFVEIREEALKALAGLTKALGDHYSSSAAAATSQKQPPKTSQSQPPPSSSVPMDTIAVPNHHQQQQHATAASSGTAATSNNNDKEMTAEELLKENQYAILEQEKIRKQKELEMKLAEEQRLKEEEERKRFKEAMDAQRELDKIAAAEHQRKKSAEEQEREMQRLSTKSADGKCQSCGLKKCKKSCMFYGK